MHLSKPFAKSNLAPVVLTHEDINDASETINNIYTDIVWTKKECLILHYKIKIAMPVLESLSDNVIALELFENCVFVNWPDDL